MTVEGLFGFGLFFSGRLGALLFLALGDRFLLLLALGLGFGGGRFLGFVLVVLLGLAVLALLALLVLALACLH